MDISIDLTIFSTAAGIASGFRTVSSFACLAALTRRRSSSHSSKSMTESSTNGLPLLAGVADISTMVKRCGNGPEGSAFTWARVSLTEPASIRSYLTGVGLSARPPPIAPARPPLQPELEYAA